MLYLYIFAYLLVGLFLAVLATEAFDCQDDWFFGLFLCFWPIAIIILALAGFVFAIMWTAQKLGIWIHNKITGDDLE